MIKPELAEEFAEAWFASWNAHDLDSMLSHYAEDVVFHSPRIRMLTGKDVDHVAGKTELRAYWSAALQKIRNLYFDLDKVLVGGDSLTILYTNERSQYVGETFIFGADGKVVRSIAAYI